MQLHRRRVAGRRHPEVARGQVDRHVDRRGEPLVPCLVEQVLVGRRAGTRRAASPRAGRRTPRTAAASGRRRPDPCPTRRPARSRGSCRRTGPPATMKSPEKPSACADRISLSTRHPAGSGGTRPCAASRSRRSTSMRSPGAPCRPSRCRSRANATTATDGDRDDDQDARDHRRRPPPPQPPRAHQDDDAENDERAQPEQEHGHELERAGTPTGGPTPAAGRCRPRGPRSCSTSAAVRLACDRPLHRRSTRRGAREEPLRSAPIASPHPASVSAGREPAQASSAPGNEVPSGCRDDGRWLP